MKITKRQLRRIIKEEKQKLLAEAGLNTLRRMRVDIDDVLMKHGVKDPVQAASMLRMLADKVEKEGVYGEIREAMEGEQLQLPLSQDPRKVEMIEDMADFLMRGDEAIIAAIDGYDSMSAEQLDDFLERVYSRATESMTFAERYGSQRDDAMRAYVSEYLGI